MEPEKLGIKELGEGIEGMMIISLILMEVGHDGFQFKDFTEVWDKLMNDEEIKGKIMMAWDDIAKAKGEASDLDVEEVFQLIMQRVLPYVGKMIAVFKKKQQEPQDA